GAPGGQARWSWERRLRKLPAITSYASIRPRLRGHGGLADPAARHDHGPPRRGDPRRAPPVRHRSVARAAAVQEPRERAPVPAALPDGAPPRAAGRRGARLGLRQRAFLVFPRALRLPRDGV